MRMLNNFKCQAPLIAGLLWLRRVALRACGAGGLLLSFNELKGSGVKKTRDSKMKIHILLRTHKFKV